MNKHLFSLLIASALLLSSCTFISLQGSGNMITEGREVSNFEEVEVCCGMQLLLTQGDREQLTLEAEDNIMPEIETIVRGRTLTVRFRPAFGSFGIRTSRPVRVHLEMPTIHGITISGGGSLDTETIESDQIRVTFSGGSRGMIGTLEAETGALETSGGSELRIESLTADSLDTEASGGGGVTIRAGTATKQEVTASGGAHYRAAGLESEVARLEVSGGSEAAVWVTESLDVGASGGSSVEYTGNPTIDQEASGGSSINSANR
ncbi:MAG: DUF2807 domain-containing protein [Caldilineaceae bacterium]|nr:DUF2807 domain-containing protein [Caldilineaceae bacterium]